LVQAWTASSNAATCCRALPTRALPQERISWISPRLRAQALVRRQSLSQVVFGDASFPEVQDRGHGVLFDGLVGLFPAGALFHRFHEDGGGGEEREIVFVFRLDYRGEGLHLTQDGEEGLKEAVGRKETVRAG
jgi:hypothetical protein